MARRYHMSTRISQRQRTSLKLKYVFGTSLIAAAIGVQAFVLGNLGDSHAVLAANTDANTSNYQVDLSGSAEETFVSPPMVRNGSSCNATADERCSTFTVFLDRDAEGLTFEQIAGDKPVGNTLYYIDCEKPTPLGTSVCLPKNNGKVTLSYCAAGSQTCVYKITSIGKVKIKADTVGLPGQPMRFNVAGLLPGTVQWTSVYPGKPGALNNYLQPNNSTATFTADAQCPNRMSFQVTGMHKNACGDALAFSDTVNVSLYQPLAVNTTPTNAVCAAGGTAVMHAGPTGGKAPYNFVWKNTSGKIIGNASECMTHDPGVYTVYVTDAMGNKNSQTVTITPARMQLPTNIGVQNATQVTALVEWQTHQPVHHCALRYRASGASAWNYHRTDGSDMSFHLKNLSAGQAYELQLMAYGDNASDSSGWSAVQMFITQGTCVDADNLRYKMRGDDAWFYWNDNTYAVKQELVLKQHGASDWERKYKLGSKVNSVVVNNLKAGVDYEWAIKSYCPSGNYSGAKEFTLSATSTMNTNGSTGTMIMTAQR